MKIRDMMMRSGFVLLLGMFVLSGCFEDPEVKCLKDERVRNGVCAACPPGTTNNAGDDASGANTTCDSVLCEANQYVSANSCVACPDGATNAAGDDASGDNTICDEPSCDGELDCVCDVQTPCKQGLECVGGKCAMMQSTCDANPGVEGCPCVNGSCAQNTSLICSSNMCALPQSCAQIGCSTNQKCQLPNNANEQGMCLQECEAGFVYDAQSLTCVTEMMPTNVAVCPSSALSCDANKTNCVCMKRVLSSGDPAKGADHEVVGNVTTTKTSMAGGVHSVLSH